MKFPRIPVALLLVAGLAWPVVVPTTASKAPKASVKSGKTTTKANKGAKAVRDDASRAVSARGAALKSKLDSLVRIDSLHRADSLRIADSLVGIGAAWRADSLHKADSLHRIDSIARIAHTWYVAKVRDFTGSAATGHALQAQLRLALLRSGGLWVAEPAAGDTCANFECSWKTGLASGAGKLVYSALYRSAADSGWKFSGWLFDMASGRKLDSAVITIGKAARLDLEATSREMVRNLHPTPAQSRCIADSLAQANTVWALEIPVNRTSDSTMNTRLRKLFHDGFAKSGRARSFSLKDSVYCPTRGCLDTLAAALGANRVVQFDISRLPDSTWRLGLVASQTRKDSLIDSFLVTARTLEGLAHKALPILVGAPASCRSACARSDSKESKLVWSVGPVQADSTRAVAASDLAKRLSDLLAADPRNQFLSLKPLKSFTGIDDLAASQGIQRLVKARLEGSDSLWSLDAIVVNTTTGLPIDSIHISRGGYRGRVFDWFGRKLLEAAHPTLAGCGNLCSEDSAKIANSTWAFAPTRDEIGEPNLAKLIHDNLIDNVVSRRLGKVVTFPDSLACQTRTCLDSIADARGAGHVVWTTLSRSPDSLWMLSARVTEAAIDLVVDSTRQSDTGNPIEALAHLPRRVVDALIPAAARCDSCVATDTLEDGLAFIEPRWTDVLDTMQYLFVDSVRSILTREGHYQVRPLSMTDSVYRPWKNGVCDSVCRAALRCRTGASVMVTSSLRRDGSGWRVQAGLTDLRTGLEIAKMSSHEHRNDVERLREIAPWVARKLVGTDTTATAPSSRRQLHLPWAKLVALVVPVTAGLVSVMSRW